MRGSRGSSIQRLLLLSGLLMFSTQASVQDRGYSSDPYARGDSEDDRGSPVAHGEGDASSRMEERGYNSDPYEVNVEGSDNIFSREEPCSPDDNGMFGTSDGIAQALAFYYQVETLPLIDRPDEANQEILETVETSVSKALLPSLFADQCAVIDEPLAQGKSTGPLRRRLQEMMGLSSNPTDTVLQGIECKGELSNEANECYVVDGNMTLYSTSPVNESFLDSIRNFIGIAMAEGIFNNLDPRIVNVSFVESLGDPDGVNVGSSEGGGDDSSLPIYAWVIMGVGLATVLATLAVRFVRNRRPDDSQLGSFRELGSFPSPTNSDAIA